MKIIYSLRARQFDGLYCVLIESKNKHGKYYAIDIYPNGKDKLRYLMIYDVFPNSKEIAEKAYHKVYQEISSKIESEIFNGKK